MLVADLCRVGTSQGEDISWGSGETSASSHEAQPSPAYLSKPPTAIAPGGYSPWKKGKNNPPTSRVSAPDLPPSPASTPTPPNLHLTHCLTCSNTSEAPRHMHMVTCTCTSFHKVQSPASLSSSASALKLLPNSASFKDPTPTPPAPAQSHPTSCRG